MRDSYLEKIDEQVDLYIERATKQAGGADELHKIISHQKTSFEDWKRKIRRRILTRFHLSSQIPLHSIAEPGPAVIREYYHSNKSEFQLPGEVVFRHIFISFAKHGGEAGARLFTSEIFNKLDGSEANFEKLAILHSDDTVSADAGGIEPLPSRRL